MDPYQTVKGIVATLDRANVDTDQIIPKQFLKSIKRTGFGPALFFDWRYLADGTSPDPDFEVNDPAFDGASILVVRNNFGCGSSREHAVWAVMQDGYRVVIAPTADRDGSVIPGFADIFRNNSTKNGLLLIQLSESEVDEIFGLIGENKGTEATVDLVNQRITFHSAVEKVVSFDVDPVVKDILLRGLDDITMTLEHEADITAFEAQHDHQLADSKS